MAIKGVLTFARAGIVFSDAPELNIIPSDCAGAGFNATPRMGPSDRLPMATSEQVALRIWAGYDISITLDKTVPAAKRWYERMLSLSAVGDVSVNTMTNNFKDGDLTFHNCSITEAASFNESHDNPDGTYTVRLSGTLDVNSAALSFGI